MYVKIISAIVFSALLVSSLAWVFFAISWWDPIEPYFSDMVRGVLMFLIHMVGLFISAAFLFGEDEEECVS